MTHGHESGHINGEAFPEVSQSDLLPETSPLYEAQQRALRNARSAGEHGLAGARTQPPEVDSLGAYSAAVREEHAADQAGTYPGSSPSDFITGRQERGNASSDKFHRAQRSIETIDPSTPDRTLQRELREAREFLVGTGIDPDLFIPGHFRR